MIVNPGIRRFSGIKPALNLVFTGGESISSMITFTRASGGTRVNSAGLIETVPVNLLTYSEDLSNAAWALQGTATKSGSNILVTSNGDSVSHSTAIAAGAVTFTAWLSGTPGETCRLWAYNATDGTVAGSNVLITLTATPTPYSSTCTPTVANSSFQIGKSGGSTAGSITFIKANLNYGSVATTYIPTTTTASGAPRFDYDPVTLAPRGLLIEESRTNLIPTSNGSFTASGGSRAAGGTYNGVTFSRFTASGGVLTHQCYSPSTAAALTGSVSYTNTALVKEVSGCQFVQLGPSTVSVGDTTTYANFDIRNGTVGTKGAGTSASGMTHYGNGVWLIWMTFTTKAVPAIATTCKVMCASSNSDAADPAFDSSGVFDAANYQTELGAFPTSYIPTTTAAVTRAADVASITGTNFSSWFNATEGTFVVGGDCPSNGAGYFTNLYGLGTSTDRITLYAYTGTSVIFEDRVANVVVASPVVTGIGTAAFKVASSYAANNINSAANGTLGTLDTACALPASMVDIGLGQALAGAGVTGARRIQRITYYNKRLPDATLKALSA